jgi:hypothetical protein
MGSLWVSLAPFVIAAALMPIELVITLAQRRQRRPAR